jgi:steroid delta-isomerase-like uncharacterized protein
MATQATPASIEAARVQLEGYNEKSWDKVRSTATSDFEYDELGTGRKLHGIEQALEAYRGWANAFPDSKGTIVKEFVSGKTVVLELVWNGTHTGPLQTPRGQISATGKKINVPACEVIEVADSKVRSVHHYFNMATLLDQIGAASK